MSLDSVLRIEVALYLGLVLAIQLAVAWCLAAYRRAGARARREQGLPDDVLLHRTVGLEELRTASVLQSVVLLLSVLVVPLLLAANAGEEAREGLSVAFLGLFAWSLWSATDFTKSFLGGLTFRTYAAFLPPFQVGDRITVAGVSGRVDDIGLFHVRLVTPDDDLVSVPTASLWSETIANANAGDRSSLVALDLFLDPRATSDQRKAAEDILWDCVQASTYFEPEKPLQIYVSQLPHAVRMTAKGYVASTYDEPLFRSEVTSRVLDRCMEQDENGVARVPLARAPEPRG
ncbi:MAG: mechanosensitive ion channel domain-containing protein [Planctomycetota bacterium]